MQRILAPNNPLFRAFFFGARFGVRLFSNLQAQELPGWKEKRSQWELTLCC